MNTDDSVEREFSSKSNRCDRPQLTVANVDDLEWILRPLALQPHFRCLEIAAGTGQLTRAIAPDVRHAIALDRQRTQLTRGVKAARKSGITNMTVQQGLAENLPYADESFELVITRFGLHHFHRPEIVLSQMKRVCRKGGRIVVLDRVAPGNSQWAMEYDRLERLRDPSHRQLFNLYELKQLFRSLNLSIVRSDSRDFPIEFQTWIDLKATAPELEYKFYVDLKRDIEGKRNTGMRPFWQNDRLFFQQIVAMVIAQK